ncbi:uncharacterized protein LOC119724848 [Patiria miniata]|uniref:Uncharacterized protein n=1 Tax=Patiria miniata TaxID=46514 RepID=A0A913ZJQ1_PATMI|nr:uncharacterized protein LOC119724848 [Patiria miniata]
MSPRVGICSPGKLTLHMIAISSLLIVVYSQSDPVTGCPPPPPQDGLVQFINGVDISTHSVIAYPVDSRITAQCSDPGGMRLTGNLNGRVCRADGKWGGQSPTCREVNQQISVSGGAVQRVTSAGSLSIYVTPTTDSVEIHCTIAQKTPELEAPHIQVDNSRVRVRDIRGDANRVAIMTLNPVLATDSGQFGCRKAVANNPPTHLRIDFYEVSLASMDCPSDIVQATEPGEAVARVTWLEPTLHTAIGITEYNKTHSPGDEFPIGETTVVYTSDTDGNEVDICRFTVTVIDEENPTFISCPDDDIEVRTDTGVATAVVTWEPIVALDNSRVVSAPAGNYQSGVAFPVGDTLVSFVARDKSGNVEFCNFTVSVKDLEPPVVHNCPQPVTASLTAQSMDSIRVNWTEPNVTDNTGRYSLVNSHAPGDLFNFGITDVSYIARDTFGNENFCVFQVIVLDEVSPTFSDCPASQTRYLGRNESEVPVYWNQPLPGDNIDIVGPTVPSHTPGQRFGLGTHTVTYTASDPAGNNGTCSFNVTVKIAQCQAEITPYSEGILTWTSALPHDLVPSRERCSVYTENAGSIRALRECVPDENRGAVWREPRLNDCGAVRDSVDLDDLRKVSIGEGNVMEVSQAVAKTVSNMTSELADNLEPVASILQNIVEAGSPLLEVTKAVIETVNSVITSVSEHDVTYSASTGEEAPSSSRASSSIVQSLEAQISLVTRDLNFLEVTERSLAVNVVTLQPYQQDEETQFLSVLDADDPDTSILQDGGVRIVPKRERGDSRGMSWPIDTAITMPADIGTAVANSLGFGSPVPLRISFVMYQSDGLFPAKNASRVLASRNTSGDYFTSGRVISATVEGVQLRNLSQPVVVEFTPHQDWNESIGVAQCVFWDFSLDNGTGDWSSDGCTYAGFKDGRIICHCYHLTNFAVLMGMKDESLPPVAQFLLDFISAVGCALSIGGVSLTLFTFVVFGNLRATRSRQILMHLCMALLCLYVAFLAGIDATNNGAICTAVAAVIHYFTLASMCWMGVEARNMYLLLVRVFKGRESRFMLKACTFAWGTPLIIVAVTFGVTFPMGTYRHDDFCFLYVGPAQYYGLLVPIALVLLHNLVTFVLVVRSLVKNDMGDAVNKQRTQLQKLSSRLQNAVCMSVLLGLSWAFGFLSITLGTFVYQLIFCLANSVQGFLVFVLFCVRSTDVRKAWRKALPIECNLRGQTYKIQERARKSVFAVDKWNCPAKLSEEDGPGLDIYMYTSWSGDGSSRWEESKYISYTSQMSQVSNGTNVIRPFSIYSSENGTVGRKKHSLF